MRKTEMECVAILPGDPSLEIMPYFTEEHTLV